MIALMVKILKDKFRASCPLLYKNPQGTPLGGVYLHMGIILAIDFGEKHTGIAVTDPMQIIASGLTTLPTKR